MQPQRWNIEDTATGQDQAEICLPLTARKAPFYIYVHDASFLDWPVMVH